MGKYEEMMKVQKDTNERVKRLEDAEIARAKRREEKAKEKPPEKSETDDDDWWD